MGCTQVQDQDLVERYLDRELTETEQAAFEAHFFECSDCYAVLTAARDVRQALGGQGRKRRRPAQPWALAAAFATATLTGTLVWHLWDSASPIRPSPPAPPSSPRAAAEPRLVPPAAVLALAAVEPPPYARVATRGSADDRLFARAMSHYAKGQHAPAAALLRQAWERSPHAPIGFYLGVCDLMEGRNAEAAVVLERVAGSPDPVFAGPARLYLAKARIRLGQVQSARADLLDLSRTQGPAAEEARTLLARLDALGLH